MSENIKKLQEDQERISALAEWRKKSWKDILTKNKKVLEAIRDNPDAKDKDRTEACKLLARMIDILSPEKVVPGRHAEKEVDWWEEDLPEGEAEELDGLINPKE